jgi:hypothetical protein
MRPDGSVTDQPLPSFLSADKTKQHKVGITWEAAVVSSRTLKISILAAAAALIGIVALQVVYPVKHVPKFMAPLTDMSTGQQDTSPSTPITRPGAEAEVSASITADAPARDEIAAAPQPAGQIQPEGNGLSSDALFAQFQAWAIKQPTRVQVDPAPLEIDAPAPIAVDTPMPAPPPQNPRKPKPAQSAQAQAQIPHIPIPRARMQWGQVAHVEGRPVPAPRVQDQAPQSAPTPSWLQSLSSHQ